MSAVVTPQTPPGFGPWQQVGSREFSRARRDGIPTYLTEFTHDDRFETAYFIAHYRRSR